MQLILIVIAVIVVLGVLLILGKQHAVRDDTKRKRQLLEMTETLYPSLDFIESLDLLYLQTYKQGFKWKLQNGNYESAMRDCNLIIELRNTFIEQQACREMDRIVQPNVFTRRIYATP